ncbi:MAG: hypothetical protein AAFV90_17845 [Cyanobacteria bacterium J06634_5]
MAIVSKFHGVSTLAVAIAPRLDPIWHKLRHQWPMVSNLRGRNTAEKRVWPQHS